MSDLIDPLEMPDSPSTDRSLKNSIRDYARQRGEMPSLEDILNDDLGDPAEFEGDDGEQDTLHLEGRPSSEDFIHNAPRQRLHGNARLRMEDIEAPSRLRGDPRKDKSPRRIATDDEERKWASIAHASAVLTLFFGIFSGGLLSLFTLMIPLAIYLHWRRKSEYVAFQALQAFTLQVLGTIGWMALLVVGTVALVVTTIALALTVVGLLALIVIIPLFVMLVFASFGMPLAMVVFSVIAATQTNQGVDYRIPRVGRWIDRQMHSGFLGEL